MATEEDSAPLERLGVFVGRTRRVLWLAFLAASAALILYLAWLGFAGSVAGMRPDPLAPLAGTSLGDRVLVVSPHPDDESLGAAGLIAQSVASGVQVRVVVVTCGDGYGRIAGQYATSVASRTPEEFLRLGRTRAAESTSAMVRLGLAARDVVFLGYPDGGLADLWQRSWSGTALRGTNGRDGVPYPFAFDPGAPYTGASVDRDLRSVIATFAPTAVVFPDAEDAHPDHWAVNAFTELALDEGSYAGTRLTYLVHRGHFPYPWSYLPRAFVAPPPPLATVGDRWVSYALGKTAEDAKGEALDAYASQRRVMGPFLDSFVRRNELFGADDSRTVVLGVETTPPLAASAMPGVVLLDPPNDTFARVMNGEADIRAVAVAPAPGGVYVGIRTRARVSAVAGYAIGLRLIGDDGVRRIDVRVQGRTGRWLREDASSVVPAAAPAVTVRGDRLWVLVPGGTLAGARMALVGAGSYVDRTLVDHTAWRRIRFR